MILDLATLGLRARLLLLVLFSIIPAFALNAYTAISQRQEAAAKAESYATNLVQLAAREQRRLIASTQQLLVSLSKLSEVKQPTTADTCHRTLVEVLKPFPYYRNIGVALADGRVFCRTYPSKNSVNISDRGYFVHAVQSRDFGIGDYQIGRATGLNSINFGQAILDTRGNVRAVVYAALDLGWLNQLVAAEELPPGSTLTVVDSRGTIVARHPDSQKWVGETMAGSTLMNTILNQPRGGTAEIIDTDNITRLHAFAPLHNGANGNVYVSIGLSKETAFAAANADFVRNVKLLFIVATLAMLFAWVGSDAFVIRRVKALANAARRLAQGELSARTGIPHGNDELGRLARAFDYMALHLQLMNTALIRVNRALKTLSACNRAIMDATDEQKLLAETCRLIVVIGGYRCAWIGYAENDENKTIRPVAEAGFEGSIESWLDVYPDVTWSDTERGRGLAATALRTVKPHIVYNLLADAQPTPWRTEATRRDYASGAALPLHINGKAIGVLVIFSREPDAFQGEELELLTETAQDVSFALAVVRARAEHDRVLEQMAYFDSLTGLPNRAHFEQRLRRALSDASHQPQSLVLMIVDLNRLWEINDAVGFHEGDQLLKEVGRRLRAVVRPDDLVARIRGDEFAVLVSVSAIDGAIIAAQIILHALKDPFLFGDLTLDISAVVGISIFPQHGTDASQLMQHADVAMHQAKNSRAGFAFYSAEDDKENAARRLLIGELRRAIEADELLLYYQPKIEMRAGHVCGVEALVRWNHPTRGMISPDAFIPLAEQTGLIKPLTEWVVGAALRQSSLWRKAGLVLPIAVNLSARNLHDADFLEKLEELFTTWSATPSWLEFEITEGAVMEDPESALNILIQLSNMGITLFIDDFGTGYSSLGYLKKLPVDAMKIDKSFVIDMLTDSGSAKIVRSTINLAHDLDLKVVAEGVENQATWNQLAALGCDVAQGYHISKPIPASQVIALAVHLTGKRRALN